MVSAEPSRDAASRRSTGTSVTRRRENGDGDGVTRRRVIGAAGAGILAAVAGCTAAGTPGRSDRRGEQTLLSETVAVPAGRFERRSFSLSDEQWVTVAAYLTDSSKDVRQDGPAVDVFVAPAGEFADFTGRGSFDYVGGVSMPDVVNGRVSASLDAGQYVLVVDNSPVGPGSPGGSGVTAVMDVDVTAAPDR